MKTAKDRHTSGRRHPFVQKQDSRYDGQAWSARNNSYQMMMKSYLLRLGLMFLGVATVVSNSAAAVQYAGVNLAGAEFGVVGHTFPGTYGTDYIYPNQTEVDYFKGKGMNI